MKTQKMSMVHLKTTEVGGAPLYNRLRVHIHNHPHFFVAWY